MGVLQACAPKGDEFKAELLSALEKQKEVRNFRFQGSSGINIPVTAPAGGAKGVLASLVNGTMTWNGVLDFEQNRMELDLGIASSGTGVPLLIPLVLAENRIYFKIPAGIENNPDFYYDYSETGSQSAISAFNDLYLEMLTRFIGALDGKLFASGEKDGDKRNIRIPINQKNWPQILEGLRPILPEAVGLLQDANLIGEAQAGEWKTALTSESFAERLAGLRLNEPGGLTFTLGENGYITAYEFELDVERPDQPSSRYKIRWSNRLSEIDEQPSFQKPVPEEARSMNALLESLLAGGSFGTGTGNTE
jgi:hypothetical protein